MSWTDKSDSLTVVTVCPIHKVRGLHGDPLKLTDEDGNWTMCDWPGGREIRFRKVQSDLDWYGLTGPAYVEVSE